MAQIHIQSPNRTLLRRIGGLEGKDGRWPREKEEKLLRFQSLERESAKNDELLNQTSLIYSLVANTIIPLVSLVLSLTQIIRLTFALTLHDNIFCRT